ncbi:hypothetical protein ACET3Z_010207 [Daucus carota]
MVVIAQPFGRVFEIWNHDMGLGPVEPRFLVVNEDEVGPGAVNDAEIIEQAGMEDDDAQDQAQEGDELLNVDGEPIEVVEGDVFWGLV